MTGPDIDGAAQVLAEARAERDALPARTAAEAAYVPGGPTVDELEQLIARQRADTFAAIADTA